ncbi:MAG: SpoIID/LytB domain-containing protein [Magnetococcales bacterium]|nr:SpoIID/LytB domain-containing protein [Magnetococcales bacterium]
MRGFLSPFSRSGKLGFLFVLCTLLFLSAYNSAGADETSDFEDNPESIAQFNINVGSLAMDERRYLDALSYFENAFETSKLEKTKVKALLYMATTFTSFLDSPDSSLKIYRQIQKEYPKFAENSLYKEILLLFETERYLEVREKVDVYNFRYGNGRYQFQVELLADEAKKVMATAAYKRKYARQEATRQQVAAIKREDAKFKEFIKAKRAEEKRFKAMAEARAKEAARLQAIARTKEAERMQAQARAEAEKAARARREAEAKEQALHSADAKAKEKIYGLASADFKKSSEPVVRVLFTKGSDRVLVAGRGLVFTSNGREYSLGSGVELKVENGQVSHNGRGFGREVKITASGPIKLSYGKKMAKSKRVRGFIMLAAKKGRVRIINHVKIEDYLLGVVPAESPPSWKYNALKSQALAARTYAYNDVRKHAKDEFDVYDSIRSQVYGGLDSEHKRTSKAVLDTRGEIITAVRNGKLQPILAMFAANSGGHTADPQKEYSTRWDSSHHYLVAHEDPWSLQSGKAGLATWEYSHSKKELERNLAKRKVRIKNLESIKPVYIGPSGRVVTVRLLYDGGKSKTIRFRPKVTLGLAGRIGTLPDTIVKIKNRGGKFVFTGRGFGHGIGYMQWGGQYMAKAGHTYREILDFYYPGTKIMQYW